MKKVILSLAILACFVSCQKAVEPESASNKPAVVAISAPSDVGLWHDYMLDKYDDEFGLMTESYQRTLTDVRTVIIRVTQMGIDEGDIVSTTDPEDYADEEIALMQDAGYFENGQLKSNSTLATMIIAKVSNPNIRTVLTNINNYSGNMNNFISYSNAQLASLTGLTLDEAEMIDGYGRILGSSYVTWGKAVTSPEKAMEIATADANGFVEGWNWAISHHYYLSADLIAKYYAVKASITARDKTN